LRHPRRALSKNLRFLQRRLGKPSSKSFVAGAGGEYWNAGLSLSFPVFDGFATQARIAKARAMLTQSQGTAGDLLDEVLVEVRKSFLNIRDAEKFVEAADEGLKLAEEGRRLAQVGYENGLSTQLDLLEADSSLTLARYNVCRPCSAT